MAQGGLEDSLIHGLDTFIDSKGHVKACFIIILLSFLLHVVGLATPGWLDGDTGRIGLWRYCRSSVEYECCQSAENLLTESAWLNASRVFLCIGLVGGLVASITIILKSVVGSLVSKSSIRYVCIISCFTTAISIIIGVSVYGGRYRFEPSLKNYHPSGSLVVCIIAGVAFLLCGALLVFGAESTSVAPSSYRSGQQTEPTSQPRAHTSQPRAEPSAPPMESSSATAPAQGPQAPLTDDPNACVICMDNQIDTLFEPCMHSKCCRQCAENLVPRDCPVCRTHIREIKRIFR